jgi:hypothetical protein
MPDAKPTEKVTAPKPASSSSMEQEKRIQRMKTYFENRPKETIRIREADGEQWVQVNGYAFQIQAGVKVKVPVDVADLLRDADVI